MASYYPIFLRLEQKPCLVVGGGKVAERKIKGLLAAGAKVTVVSPEVTPEIEKLSEEGKIKLHKRPYQPEDLKGAFLVIAATNNPQLQEKIAKEADSLGIPCNVVDQPELSSFIVPSVIRRGRLSLAISTSGASPAVARRIREKLEEIFGPEYEEYLDLMALWRQEILARDLTEEKRRQIFEHLSLLPIPEWIKRNERVHLESIAKTYQLSLSPKK